MRILTVLLSSFLILATAITASAQKASDAELEFWRSIKGSKDAAEYQAYLKAFPNGVFAPIARIRLKRLVPGNGSGADQAKVPDKGKMPEKAKAPEPAKAPERAQAPGEAKPPALAKAPDKDNALAGRGSNQPGPAKLVQPGVKPKLPANKPEIAAKPDPSKPGQPKGPVTAKATPPGKPDGAGGPDQKPMPRLAPAPKLAGPSPMGPVKEKPGPGDKDDPPEGDSAGMVPPETVKPATPGNSTAKVGEVPEVVGDYGAIGVQLQWFEAKDAVKAGLPEKSGAKVTELLASYPSAAAGLKVGDFIVAADGKPIPYLVSLINLIRKKAKGTSVELGVHRAGKETKVTVPVARMMGTPLGAARAGDTAAMVRVALLYFAGAVGDRNTTEGQVWLNKAAAQGDAFGHIVLGRSLEAGRNGYNVNRIRAFRSYMAASEKGNAEGAFNVARFYELGLAGETEPAKARGFYETAVKAGHLGAHIRLGEMLLDGKGGAAEPLRAIKLFEDASKKGSAEAGYRLAKLYHDGGIGIPQDCAKARAGYEVALTGFEAGAAWGLGLLHLDGCGVAKDREKAITYFRRAAALDHRPALDRLEQMGLTAYAPREIQEILDELGYRPGNVDGRPGQQTRRAIIRFQRDIGIAETGELSLDLLKRLRQRAAEKRKKEAEEKNPPPKLWVPTPVAKSDGKKGEGSQFSERGGSGNSGRSGGSRRGGPDGLLDGLMGGGQR